MKIRYCTLALVGLTLSASALRAQSPSPSPAPSLAPLTDKAPKENATERKAEKMQVLTPDEQVKLRAARKAARQDPAVKEAEAKRTTDPKAFRQAMRDAMIRKDPSMTAILDKMEASKVRKKKDQ